MKLFDLHCDTATRLFLEKQGLYDNNSLHVSLKRAHYIEKYAQVMAIWTNNKLSDEDGYARFFDVLKNLENEVVMNKGRSALTRNSIQLTDCLHNGKIPLILAVEDARILANDINRLVLLYSCGVRILTLNWYGVTCIGGAHNTDMGLSNFGIEVVKKCFELGIVPDVSHCSFSGAEMTLDLAKEYHKPIIASHSDSYTLNPHSRNLTDVDFKRISELGGLVGINLCPSHLSASDNANLTDIIKHIEHYLSLGGHKTIAIGGDLDGTNLPNDFGGIEDIYKIANEMQRLNYSNELVEDIMYYNALNFFIKNI